MIGEVTLRGTLAPGDHWSMQQALSFLQRELGCDAIRARAQLTLPDLCIGLHDWSHSGVDLLGFDRMMAASANAGEFRLVLWSRDWHDSLVPCWELLTRYQHLLPIPESCSSLQRVKQALAAHRLIHPLDEPRAQRSYEHALDTWRWLLRLDPGAELGLQLAALFHEAGAPDSGCVTDAGSALRVSRKRLSARAACRALEPLSLQPQVLAAMVGHIMGDGSSSARDQQLLRDADALSFISRSTWHYLQQHGARATTRRVAEAFSSMSDVAACLALMTRQPHALSGMFEAVPCDCPA
jgi:hypothetical protein